MSSGDIIGSIFGITGAFILGAMLLKLAIDTNNYVKEK